MRNEQFHSNRLQINALAATIRTWKKRRKTNRREGFSLSTIDSSVRSIRAELRILHIAQSLWRAFKSGRLPESSLTDISSYISACATFKIDAGARSDQSTHKVWEKQFPTIAIKEKMEELIKGEQEKKAREEAELAEA